MTYPTVKTDTVYKGLLFLMAPEDSTGTPSGTSRKCKSTTWYQIKTALWVFFSVLAAMLVGQL